MRFYLLLCVVLFALVNARVSADYGVSGAKKSNSSKQPAKATKTKAAKTKAAKTKKAKKTKKSKADQSNGDDYSDGGDSNGGDHAGSGDDAGQPKGWNTATLNGYKLQSNATRSKIEVLWGGEDEVMDCTSDPFDFNYMYCGPPGCSDDPYDQKVPYCGDARWRQQIGGSDSWPDAINTVIARCGDVIDKAVKQWVKLCAKYSDDPNCGYMLDATAMNYRTVCSIYYWPKGSYQAALAKYGSDM